MMNIDGANHGLLRIYKLNDNRSSAALQITAFEKDAKQPSLPDTSSVLNQIAQAPELAAYTEGKAFHGNTNIVITASSEMAEKMDSILNRLDEESQKHLIDSGLMTDEKFLELAAELDDEELQQLSQTLQGLDTGSALAFNSLSSEAQNNLVDVLSTANDQTRSKILEQAAQYASKVAPDTNDKTYDFMGRMNYSSTSDDLHSFVRALGETEDADQFLDNLNAFDEQQQSELLNVMSLDYALGERLMEQLSGKEKEVRDSLLNFFGDVAATSTRMESRDFEGPKMPGTLFSGTIPGSDNFYADVSKGLIEDTLSLLENHELSDEQLLKMGDELNSMQRTDQRAYIAITKTGLEELLGSQGSHATSEQTDQALSLISALRSDSSVRTDVFMARYGDTSPYDSKFFERKDKYEADQDMLSAIKALFN